ncbi:VanZ family protein [Bacillus sp. NSP9.1]|uniref:VanZ family protein n=1 Tax=Bacillus sp. NSP9.1 TaxID=1071078 RepID=UPI00041AD520|nr:VanZ family protein [Bacillus sp. NSP9.1]QHZ48305.1 VanZ family protein [Bacillus sp. NSP9.1]
MLFVDLLILGIILSFIYFLYDVVKNRKRTSFFRKIVFASFLVYLCAVFQLTMGGIHVPDQEFAAIDAQLIPFYFVGDLFQMYQAAGFDWFFWHAARLTFYNVLLLAPLGVYLSLLWRHLSIKSAAILLFLTSFFIECLQLVLSAAGMIAVRTFNVDDLILNTLGGVIGFCLCTYMLRVIGKRLPAKNLYI